MFPLTLGMAFGVIPCNGDDILLHFAFKLVEIMFDDIVGLLKLKFRDVDEPGTGSRDI